jgi:hypothetical protein
MFAKRIFSEGERRTQPDQERELRVSYCETILGVDGSRWYQVRITAIVITRPRK